MEKRGQDRDPVEAFSINDKLTHLRAYKPRSSDARTSYEWMWWTVSTSDASARCYLFSGVVGGSH